MPRWLRIVGRVVMSLASLCGGIVILIALLPVFVPVLANMQPSRPMSIIGQILWVWFIGVIGGLIYVVVSRSFASKQARDDLTSKERALDVFRRKRAAIEGKGFSDQDRKIVDDEILEAEANVKTSARKFADALRDDVLSLLTWRRIHLRQPALSLADAGNINPTQQGEKDFVARLRSNQASIDAALLEKRRLTESYGCSSCPAMPVLPQSPLFVAASPKGGPKNRFLRFFWRIADVHVCFVRSLGTVLAIFVLNFAYRDGFRKVMRVAHVTKWAINVVLACFLAVFLLAIPPLVFERDTPVGRRCASMLCKFYLRFTPCVRINGPAGEETTEVPYLHAAAATGRRIAVESLIGAGADPQAGLLNRGPTARELAAYMGHEELLELLPSEQSDTLSVAVTQSNLSRARWLIWNSGTRTIVNAPDQYGISPFHYAVSSGNLAGVRLLVDQKADPNIHSKDFPLTPLHVAVFRGDVAIVEFLLENGADPDASILEDPTETPLMCAKMVANLGRFQRSLLEALLRIPLPAVRYHAIARQIEAAGRVFPYNVMREVRIARERASAPNDKRPFDKLLDLLRDIRSHGNVNAQDGEGMTALIWASGLGLEHVAVLLIKNGAHVNAAGKGGRINALAAAVAGGYLEGARALITGGADATGSLNVGNVGKVPLLIVAACAQERVEPVALLVENGADVNAKGEHNTTALMGASTEGHDDIVRYLLERGADINARTHPDGETSLMAAAMQGHSDVVKTLLAKGADVALRNSGNKTAAMLAGDRKHAEIVRILAEGK